MASNVDPGQTPHYAASDLDLHCTCLSDRIFRVNAVGMYRASSMNSTDERYILKHVIDG